MKLTSALLIFGLLGKFIYLSRNLEYFSWNTFFNVLAGIHGQGLLQSGKEYVYQTVIRSAAGTMDVATHTSGESYKCRIRIQKSGNTLNVHVSTHHFIKLFWVHAQCGNFIIFVSLIFYVKLILEILAVQNLPFLHI